jgi:hypothetical protein
MDKRNVAGALALLAMVSGGMLAQAPAAAQANGAQAVAQQADLPARVGRIAYVEGEVNVESDAPADPQAPANADANGAVPITVAPALLNWPVAAHQVIVTGANGRTEVRIGPATLRIAANSALEIDALDDTRIAVMLHHGGAIVHAATQDVARAIEFDTPDGRLTLAGAGIVRIDVPGNAERTSIRVWQGAAQFDTGRERVPVRAGGMLDVDARDGVLASSARPDAFDDWSAARDREERASRTLRYVSSDVTGYEELDRYGDWREDTPYGALWTPRTVGSDWAPYRDGRWTWVSPWGWTWIDQAPWGYATTHYGRWVWFGNHWSWAPGMLAVRPVWAPALVSWVSYGGGGYTVVDAPSRFAIGLQLGWYPLGPLDPYLPPYWVSFERLSRYNAGHLPRFDPRHPGVHRGAYRGRPNAVTSLPPVQQVRDNRGYGTHHSQPVFIPTPVRGAHPAYDWRRADNRPGIDVRSRGAQRPGDDDRRSRWTRRPGGLSAPVTVAPVAPAPAASATAADIQRRREREEEQRRDAARQAEGQAAGRLRQADDEQERRLREDRRRLRDTGGNERQRNLEEADQRLRGDVRRQQEEAQAQLRVQAEQQRQREGQAEAQRQRDAQSKAEAERQRNAAGEQQRQRETQARAEAERQRNAVAEQQHQRDVAAADQRQREAREGQARVEAERQRNAAAEQQRQRDVAARTAAAEQAPELSKVDQRLRDHREAQARAAAGDARRQEVAQAAQAEQRQAQAAAGAERQRQQEAAQQSRHAEAERQRAAPAPAAVAAASQPAPVARNKEGNKAERDRDDAR